MTIGKKIEFGTLYIQRVKTANGPRTSITLKAKFRNVQKVTRWRKQIWNTNDMTVNIYF